MESVLGSRIFRQLDVCVCGGGGGGGVLTMPYDNLFLNVKGQSPRPIMYKIFSSENKKAITLGLWYVT